MTPVGCGTGVRVGARVESHPVGCCPMPFRQAHGCRALSSRALRRILTARSGGGPGLTRAKKGGLRRRIKSEPGSFCVSLRGRQG